MKLSSSFTSFVIIFVAIAFGGMLFFTSQSKKQSSLPMQNNKTTQNSQNQSPLAQKYFLPITDYEKRLTFRWFGKFVVSTEKATPCGASFSGYHDGDDLEILENETNSQVPVVAISDGTVASISTVSGYGGLLVLNTNISDSDYTLYYGHIDLGSSNLKTGEAVKAGQFLANLGSECSVQTSGERKHLHFAIHKGKSIDVRGYVPDLNQLANWVNPKEFLHSIGAK